MIRVLSFAGWSLLMLSGVCFGQKTKLPSFSYDQAHAHEIKPHRRTIPMEGVKAGFNQLHLKLTVSPVGFVTQAEASADAKLMKYWPRLENEVYQWKFKPFEKNGSAVTAELEEYIDLVPPERFPLRHVAEPTLRKDSKVSISLERTGCFGSCPSYTVTLGTDGILFAGRSFVVAEGRHTTPIDPDEVRVFAKRFLDADFYSMNEEYAASVTDMPTQILSISIDGHARKVLDYVGEWVGMPAVISELENEVDDLAQTNRWVEGSEGLVQALKTEHFDLQTFAAQRLLREAANKSQIETVRELLEAGVPLDPLPNPKPQEGWPDVGWLTSAANNPQILQLLIDAKASKDDQVDKDLALNDAARCGQLESARALIGYGANPEVDLSTMTVTRRGGSMSMRGPGLGSILTSAAESGKPEMVREILRFHPKLEARGYRGQTAMFAAGSYRDGDEDGARAECVRLLARAGANVNARDDHGNTPLHETFLSEVEEELLKLGADVNARNQDGETPIFTTVDDKAMALFIAHGADLTIRNNKGQTVVEAARGRGPMRVEALRKAMQEAGR